MRTLKWLIGGAALAWVVGGFLRRTGMATRVFPFLPNPGSPVAREMFHIESAEPNTPPPASGVGGDGAAEDQQHVAAAYDREHGHPKR